MTATWTSETGGTPSRYDHIGVPGISFFSPTVLSVFPLTTAFGACGLTMTVTDATKSVGISAPISAMAGLIMATLAFLCSTGV